MLIGRRRRRVDQLTSSYLRDQLTHADLTDELEGVHPVVLEESPAGLALFQRLEVPPPITIHEVERHPGTVVQPPAAGGHASEYGRGAEKVLDSEASSEASANQVHRIGSGTLDVAGDRRGVAEATEKDPLGWCGVGYRPSAVGGHEDDVSARDGLGQVLIGEGP